MSDLKFSAKPRTPCNKISKRKKGEKKKAIYSSGTFYKMVFFNKNTTLLGGDFY